MILDTLKSKQLEALKAKDASRLEVLRYLLAQMKNREIELRPAGKDFTDEEALKVLKKQIKQREDTIENFKQSGRQDLIDKESAQRDILKDYLSLFQIPENLA